MWLVGGGGEVVEAMHQLMWKYKYKVSQWNKEAHIAVQCPAFTFVKAKGSLCRHKTPNGVPKALANHTNGVHEC